MTDLSKKMLKLMGNTTINLVIQNIKDKKSPRITTIAYT